MDKIYKFLLMNDEMIYKNYRQNIVKYGSSKYSHLSQSELFSTLMKFAEEKLRKKTIRRREKSISTLRQ